MPRLNPFKKRVPSPQHVTTPQRSAIAITGCVLILSGFAIYDGIIIEPNTTLATLKIAIGVTILFGSAYIAYRCRQTIMTALLKPEPAENPDQPVLTPVSEDPPATP